MLSSCFYSNFLSLRFIYRVQLKFLFSNFPYSLSLIAQFEFLYLFRLSVICFLLHCPHPSHVTHLPHHLPKNEAENFDTCMTFSVWFIFPHWLTWGWGPVGDTTTIKYHGVFFSVCQSYIVVLHLGRLSMICLWQEPSKDGCIVSDEGKDALLPDLVKDRWCCKLKWSGDGD